MIRLKHSATAYLLKVTCSALIKRHPPGNSQKKYCFLWEDGSLIHISRSSPNITQSNAANWLKCRQVLSNHLFMIPKKAFYISRFYRASPMPINLCRRMLPICWRPQDQKEGISIILSKGNSATKKYDPMVQKQWRLALPRSDDIPGPRVPP